MTTLLNIHLCLRRLVDWRYKLDFSKATLFIEVLEDAEVVLLSKKTTTSV
jgi:hypothetical protein